MMNLKGIVGMKRASQQNAYSMIIPFIQSSETGKTEHDITGIHTDDTTIQKSKGMTNTESRSALSQEDGCGV